MPQPWEIITSEQTCGSLPARSAISYAQVCAQFDVVNAAEFQPQRDDKGNITWTACNIFVWRCTKALGCELPHWWFKGMSPSQRDALKIFLTSQGLGPGVLFDELNANRLNDWLHLYGPKHGWFKVVLSKAAEKADAGFPTVATVKVPQGTGHVAMLLPRDTDGEVHIAQAGAECLWDMPIVKGFGALLPKVEYFTHDD